MDRSLTCFESRTTHQDNVLTPLECFLKILVYFVFTTPVDSIKREKYFSISPSRKKAFIYETQAN